MNKDFGLLLIMQLVLIALKVEIKRQKQEKYKNLINQMKKTY